MAEYILDRASMWINDADHNHGDTIELDPKRGKELEEAGVVVPKAKWDAHLKEQQTSNEGLAKARADAEKAAADAERRKVERAAAARRETAAVPADPRRRPARS